MIELLRTNNQNKDFQKLVQKLDTYLATTDGEEHGFYDQYNGTQDIKHVVLATIGSEPIGCGTFKVINDTTVEIKRMFVEDTSRNKGVAGRIVQALEQWSQELGYKHARLETGKRQIEAVQFYQKVGYQIIPNFEPYIHMDNSICFLKNL